MTYRCEVDISFEREDDYISFLNLIQKLKGKIAKGNEKDPIPTVARVRHYECRHDEKEPVPCGTVTPYKYLDLKGKDEVFKTKAGKVVTSDIVLKEEKI